MANISLTSNINIMHIMKNLSHHHSVSARAAERLITGKKINRSADDPAGYAMSEKMKSQLRGLMQGAENVRQAKDMLQTKDGGLSITIDMLQRQRELTLQAMNDTQNESDRLKIQQEMDMLTAETSAVANRLSYNTMALLGSNKTLFIQSGANSWQGNYVQIHDCRVEVIQVKAFDVTTRENAEKTLDNIDKLMGRLSDIRSKGGALQSGFSFTEEYLEIAIVRLHETISRIEDADMAKEMMDFTKSKMLAQFGTALLAQAMQEPEMVLKLLKPEIKGAV